MKIVTWNCNGALRKKIQEVDSLDADVLVIQECENPAESTKQFRSWASDYLWIGESKNKGIGVFPKKGNTVRKLEWQGMFEIQGLLSKSNSIRWKTSDLKLFLPFGVNDEFNVLGVWTKGSDSGVFGYMGQFWKFLQIHHDDLAQDKTLILGDFNSNEMWNKPDRWWNHSDVVIELKKLGIESLYHHQHKEAQGEESKPTFFHRRKETNSYHIDYVFCTGDLLSNSNLRIGKKKKWIAVSDHMPLIVTVEC